MKEKEEIFDSKAECNKWLLELKDYEKELIKDMMYEAAKIAFGEGTKFNDKLMLSQYLIERQKQKLGLAVKEEKKQKPISIKSVKRAAEEKLYLKKKKEYLTAHIRCEVKGCNLVSEDIHHKRGRVGKLLYDERYFLAVCRLHHTEIEINPDWAIKNGYSLKRLNETV